MHLGLKIHACVHNQYIWALLSGLKRIRVIEGKIWTGRRGRRRKKLVDDFKETESYWKLKAGTLVRTLWRSRVGKGCGPVVRQRDG
jgi:hypothetical protein